MRDTTFTPGPWKMRDHHVIEIEAPLTLDHPDANGQDIARVWATPNRYANAQLIAAAPSLLEALERAEDTLDMLADVIDGTDSPGSATARNVRDQARAAISLARGEATLK